MANTNPTDLAFMKMALAEARKGIGRTSPNPAVGAVVVRDGVVRGKGYHRKAGAPHAEIHALHAAGEQTRGATLYVTLEPCNHTGRTPPCTEAILAHGVRRVVVGMADPNPRVTGQGCAMLSNHGITVECGVLEEACRQINRPFVKHCTTGMPWVVMKAGLSLDGKIATHTRRSGYITNERSRQAVHRLRDRLDSILVGVGTILADNPSLTTRLRSGQGRDPLRIVLDTHLRTAPTARILTQQSTAATWIFCGPQPDSRKRQALEAAGAMVIPAPLQQEGAGHLDLRAMLQYLGDHQVTSVLVEGGGRIHGSMLHAGLVDHVMLFLAPVFLGADGVPVLDAQGPLEVRDGIRLSGVRTRRFGDDLLIEGRPGRYCN